MNWVEYLPFSSLWSFRRLVGEDFNTVLDLGCGDGKFMKSLVSGHDWNVVGVDIFSDSP